MLTLIEAMKGESDIFRRGVIATFLEDNRLAQLVPFDNISGSHEGIEQESTQPTVATRGVNEAWTASEGRTTEIVMALKIYGGDIGIDPFIMKTKGQAQAARQVSMKIKAISNRWLLDFFKGDSVTQPRDMEGLQARLDGYNVVSAGATANGATLSLATLDEAIQKCHGARILAMGRKMMVRLTQAARTPTVGGYLTRDVDAFGRPILLYNGLEIVPITDNAGNDDILGFTEAAASGTATASSIYIMGLGEQGVRGIQSGPPEPRNVGESNTTPIENTRVEWYTHFHIMHPRSVVRVRNIADAVFAV